MRTATTSISAHLSATTSLTRPALLALLAAGAVVLPSGPSLALDDSTLPFGESVVDGSASFDRSTTNVLNIHQSTDRVVINWKGFNIGSNATTQFYQPNSGSLAVNRVQSAGTDPTRILGTLKANGRVMVLDRNGVLFGANSRVDVGGIVASTGDVDTASVMRGDRSLVLTGLGTSGSVVNEGLVNVADGGLAAFVAPTVRNNGVINAKLGKVALAAGTESATVDLYGDGLVSLALSKTGEKVLAENSGAINAESGTVLLTASAAKDVVDTVVNMSGVVNASSATMVGGSIVLSGGEGGKVKVSGKVSANGKNGGGKVNVKGKSIEVTSDADVSADATVSGNGGSIYIVAEKDATIYGAISAKGGATSGNGGFVEVSGLGTLDLRSATSTQAVNGVSGTVLIDPISMVLHNGTYTGLIGTDSYFSQDYTLSLLELNNIVHFSALDTMDVGTDTVAAGVGNGAIDLSHVGPDATNGNVTFSASNAVNFNKDLTIGNGNIKVLTPTLNLASTIYGLVGGSTVALGDSRLDSEELSTINVRNPNAKINQAIGFANGGETINVSAGTYAESVLVNKSVSLYGSDVAHITPNSPGFDVTANNVTIDGFEISGADDGIRVTNANNVTINHNHIHDIDGDGVRIRNSNGTKVTDNNMHDIRSTGEFIGSGVHATDSLFLNISGNAIWDTQWDGVRLVDGSLNEVRNNIIDGVARTGVFLGAEDFAYVSDNSISHAGRSGVNISGGVSNAAVGNGISYTGLNGILLNYTRDSSASGNDISHTGLSGVYSEGSNNVRIVENHINNTGSHGISILGGANGTVTGNFVGVALSSPPENIAGDGIRAENTTGTNISDNQIGFTKSTAFNVGSGIQVINGSNLYLHNNLIWNTGWDGIRVDRGSGIQADHNVIHDVARTGIFLGEHVNGTITDSSIRRTGRSGINITGGRNNAVTDNAISYTGLNGVLLNYTNTATLNGNRIAITGLNGVSVEHSSKVKVQNGNDIKKTTAHGVSIVDSAETEVNGNWISQTGGSGIFVDPSPYTQIISNMIDNTGSHGITVLDSEFAVVNGNSIGTIGGANNINGDGIHFERSNYATAFQNHITNTTSTAFNIGSGIQSLYGNSGQFNNNVIWNTEWDGVRIDHAPNTMIANNEISNVDRTGIYMGSSDNALALNNSINGAGRYGINISGGGNTVAQLNVIRNTGLNGILLNYTVRSQAAGNNVGNTGLNGIAVENSYMAQVNEANYINNTGLYGISVNNSGGTKVEGNFIGTTGAANNINGDGVHIVNSANVQVLGNQITNTTSTGFNIGSGVQAINSANILVDGNTIWNTEWDGVRIDQGSGAIVRNNSIDDVIRTGVYFGNINGGLVYNNHISNAGRYGVNITLGTNNTVDENCVADTGLSGILLNYSASANVTDNNVSGAGEHGIYADNSNNATITGNRVYDSRRNGIATLASSDVTISDNRVSYSQVEGIRAQGGHNVDITNNKVSYSGSNGISSYNVHDILISGNKVRHSGVEGFGNGIYVYDDAEYSNPVINILNNNVKYSSLDGIHVDAYGVGSGYGALINVNDNIVAESGDDGIDVNYFHSPYYYGEGYAPLRAELTEGEGSYGLDVALNILRNTVTNSADDGIHVLVSEGYSEGSARIAPEGIPYRGSAAYNIVIANNIVTNDTFSGEGSTKQTIVIGEGYSSNGNGDGIEVESYLNPWMGSVSNTHILDNNVSNFMQNGIYASGPSHSYVEVAGNTLTDNTVGARFESGLIDLTGATNVINGGSIGLLFSPYSIYAYDDISAYASIVPELPSAYAQMALVGDTIGTTEFNGQSDFFVRLENGAFFDPGRPTLLDGLQASYNGFRPSDVGGVLTQPQYDYLESMFWHYNDDPAVGLFFFGAVPVAPQQIAQEDIFNLFGAFDPNSPSGGLIISGLPSIGGGQGGAGAGAGAGAGGAGGAGGNPFADITPAAGDEADQGVQTAEVQNIEPAAGEDSVSDAACWNDAANYLGQGTPVSYSFGDQAETLLKKAASCGTGQTAF